MRPSFSTVKRILVGVLVAAIPAWYGYRTLVDHRNPRVTWNDVFLSDKERLQKELEEERENSRKKLVEMEEQVSIQKRRQDSADDIRRCDEILKLTRADYDSVIAEQNLWKAEVDPLLHSQSGKAIAENRDYVAAFKELRSEFNPEEVTPIKETIDRSAKYIELAKSENRIDVETHSERYDLSQCRGLLQKLLAKLQTARTTILALVKLANHQSPDSLEDAVLRERIGEIVEPYKARREYARMFGH
jgi:hypothetical protein